MSGSLSVHQSINSDNYEYAISLMSPCCSSITAGIQETNRHKSNAETELRQISNRRRDKFYFAFVSNYLMEESESDCVEYKV